MRQQKFHTHDQVVEQVIGKKGTPRRDEYERNIELFLVGHAIKDIRQSQHLTQEDLGKAIGVQKSQISKIEKGENLTLNTIRKVFDALNVDARISISRKGFDIAMG